CTLPGRHRFHVSPRPWRKNRRCPGSVLVAQGCRAGPGRGSVDAGEPLFLRLGVPQSYTTAYAWCELAQDNGQAEAQMCRDAALQSLTEDAQLRDAFRMVREFRERFGRASNQ